MSALKLPPPGIKTWRRRDEEAVGSYRVFDVWRTDFEDGSGRRRGDAFTLRMRDWCNVLALTPEDDAVFVWQYRFGTDALSLELPGGVIDVGESPEAAAQRELREETGYEGHTWSLLTVAAPNPAIQNNRCFTFLARGARLTRATSFDPQEELETVLVPSARIPDLLDSGQVTHSLVQGPLETYWRKRSMLP